MNESVKPIEWWLNKIHCEKIGQMIIKEIPDNSIDCIVTDPPYGYNFMGKDWDKAVPSVEWWKECLRVLKAGAFMFVMSAPRQDVLSQMIVRLGQAGFETGFTSIYWAYASGFPKAMNVSLAVDKQECRKQLREKLGREPSKEEFKEAWKQFRKVLGESPYNYKRPNEGKTGNTTYAQGGYKAYITEPVSDKAKVLDGSYGGFQPKPAVEIIIVCMKPLSEKTYVEQALKNGKGITLLDDARIPYTSKDDVSGWSKTGADGSKGYQRTDTFKIRPITPEEIQERCVSKGRFPANLLVSDDVLNDGKLYEGKKPFKKLSKYAWVEQQQKNQKFESQAGLGEKGSFGSFSRYFDLDKWFEKAVENLPEDVKKTFPFLICPKASKSEREAGGTGERSVTEGFPETQRVNIHPTVKPIKLMSYLVTLGSREGDIILDPFVGSGTTCISAKMLNRKWIGIDCYPEYCEIASARLENCEIVRHDLTSEEKIVEQQSTVQPIEKPVEIKQEIKEEGIKCPKCGTKMYKGKKAYYCIKANCDGMMEIK